MYRLGLCAALSMLAAWSMAGAEQPKVKVVDPPAVREPAVREPAVREPAVREPAVREPAAERAAPRREAPARAKSESGDERGQTRVSDLLDTDLVTEDGKDLGVVKDLVIDNASGQVQYVVILDDEDYRAIPWKTLSFYQGESQKDRYFILGMEQNRFQKAPAIPRQDWTNYSPKTWNGYAPQVNKYYSDVRAVRPGAVRRAERRVERNP